MVQSSQDVYCRCMQGVHFSPLYVSQYKQYKLQDSLYSIFFTELKMKYLIYAQHIKN